MSDQLAEQYRRMPDEHLLRFAVQDARDLMPHAQSALKAELEARGIDAVVGQAVDAQNVTLTADEIDTLVEAIRRQPCPECGERTRLLNGAEIAEAKSLLLFTFYQPRIVVACPDCIAAQAKRAALITSVLGWWAFPFGPFQTVKALRRNIRAMGQRTHDEPSDALYVFVEANPGVALTVASI